MTSIEQRGATRFRFLGFAALPCAITVGEKSWSGTVINASATGLGIEINAQAAELVCHSSINVSLKLPEEMLSIGGKLTHIEAREQCRKLKLGVRFSDNHGVRALNELCHSLVKAGRATGLALKRNNDEGSTIVIHGALSLKTVTDAINLMSTSQIDKVDLSDCRIDGTLGAQLGVVAVKRGVKIGGCDSQISQLMLHAGVCPSCQGC